MTNNAAWTTRRVREVMLEAMVWAKQYAGPVGPTSMRGSMPNYKASLEDHLEEGWGIPEIAGDEVDEERPIRIPVTPERADFLMRALSWQAIYLVNTGHTGSARILGLWLHHASGKRGARGFDAVLKRRGLSRGHAYRLRDRGLSLIAQGLTADGVPLG